MRKKNPTKKPLVPKRFLAFALQETERVKQTGRYGLASNYRNVYYSFKRFLTSIGRLDVSFSRMNPQLLEDYQTWLWSSGLCRNSTSAYLRVMQAIHSKGIQMGLPDSEPFKNVYRGVARTTKRALTIADIRHIQQLDIAAALQQMGYDLNGPFGQRRLQQVEFARDVFIFSFCARGMTFVDLAHLRKSDIDHGILRYSRKKTRQQLEVKVEPMMQAIINRYTTDSPYLFPIIDKGADKTRTYSCYRYGLQRYNAMLKILSQMLGSEAKLTSYVSRHSWATAALYQHVPLSIISQAMGHDSEKTTTIYLKSLESSQIDSANHNLLEHIFQ